MVAAEQRRRRQQHQQQQQQRDFINSPQHQPASTCVRAPQHTIPLKAGVWPFPHVIEIEGKKIHGNLYVVHSLHTAHRRMEPNGTLHRGASVKSPHWISHSDPQSNDTVEDESSKFVFCGVYRLNLLMGYFQNYKINISSGNALPNQTEMLDIHIPVRFSMSTKKSSLPDKSYRCHWYKLYYV